MPVEKQSNPIVWVVQEGNNDYAPAEEYGDVRFITSSDYTKIEGSQQNKNVEHDIKRFLSFYIPGRDHIIPSGNPMVAALVSMSLPPHTHNMLKWDGRRALYIPYKLTSIK